MIGHASVTLPPPSEWQAPLLMQIEGKCGFDAQHVSGIAAAKRDVTPIRNRRDDEAGTVLIDQGTDRCRANIPAQQKKKL